ncbi:MAG TPA: exosortase [Pyrinomonadaceae bacterium]|nr:exosortase [Pyrinomonadaceae bacterium]
MPLPAQAEKFWKPLLLAAAVAFVYWGVLVRLGGVWWDDENYSHGLLIPVVIGYILWTERERLARIEPRPSTLWGGAAVALALAALWAGTAGAELFLQRSSLVLLLGGVAVYFWGFPMLRAVMVPLLLLALAIPIPSIIFNKVAFPLQLFASRCAVWAMRQFDIPVLREGNVIELLPLGSTATKKLEVVEACSGIRSLMTLVTLAVVFAYFTRPAGDGGAGGAGGGHRRWFGPARFALIVLAAVPIAILTNAARVSGTGVLSHYYGTRVADGFFHSFSGWVVYVVAFLLLFAFGWLVDRFEPGRGGKGQGGGGAAEPAAAGLAHAAQSARAGESGPVVAPTAAMTGGSGGGGNG